MGILINIKILMMVMLGALLIIATILFLIDFVHYGIVWLINRHYTLGYKFRRAIYHLCITLGLSLIWFGVAQQHQLLTTFLALSNPETSIAIDKPKFKKEKIKSLTPKIQFQAQKAKLEGVGTLEIPSVNMKLPIFNGLTNLELARGACVMEAGMRMGHGNYALAGHYLTKDGALFSPIANIKKNDKIYVKSQDRQYIYRAYLNKKILPTDTKVIEQTKKKIVTLITCADGGSKRYLVRGRLIKVKKA